MTSASELFYTRRSRVGRADPDLGLDSLASDRSFHNRRHHHSHRHDLDGCDPLRRSPHVRHLCHRPSHSERASARLDQGASQHLSSNNSINSEISIHASRPNLNGNERLPGTVLLARARLLERLRGVSLSGDRRTGRSLSNTNQRENFFGDELRLVDAGDWAAETSTGRSAGSSPFYDLMTSQTEGLHLVQEQKKKKPHGLTQDALDCLRIEVFNSFEMNSEGESSKTSLDCGICLESFTNGDELICLPCEHRFHSTCLDPWVRSCGDCPYCRRNIVVNSHKSVKGTSNSSGD